MAKLKKGQEAFTIVDGRDAGKTFEKEVEYASVPKGYESRFASDLEVKKVKPGVNQKLRKGAGNAVNKIKS